MLFYTARTRGYAPAPADGVDRIVELSGDLRDHRTDPAGPVNGSRGSPRTLPDGKHSVWPGRACAWAGSVQPPLAACDDAPGCLSSGWGLAGWIRAGTLRSAPPLSSRPQRPGLCC